MARIGITWLIVVMLLASVPAVVSATSLSDEGNIIVNRGIFGVVYTATIGTLRVFEHIVFGRYGIKGLNDYFRVDRMFDEQTPKY